MSAAKTYAERISELLNTCTPLEDMPQPFDHDRRYTPREIERLNSDKELRCLVPELLKELAAPPSQTPYASAFAEVTAAWVAFSRRLEIAEKAGTVVDAQFNQIVRGVVEYMVREKEAPPPVPEAQQRTAFSAALRGLVESLSRAPIPEELRFAAHELTVMADRISARARRGEDEDA